MISVWRHARPDDILGRCIGRTDVAVDPRRSRRLAHRIRAQARRENAPRVIWTSPLRRCAAVGRWLARWGWTHRIDPRLLEVDFGRWDGRLWDDIGPQEVDAWCRDLGDHPPGGGESVVMLMARCASFIGEHPDAWIVGHAGWMNAAARVLAGSGPPRAPGEWPPGPRYGALWRASSSGGAESQ